MHIPGHVLIYWSEPIIQEKQWLFTAGINNGLGWADNVWFADTNKHLQLLFTNASSDSGFNLRSLFLIS